MPTCRRIFISATSHDLKSCRQLISDTLLSLDWAPVVQDDFPPNFGDACAALRETIAACDGVVHLAGDCYGDEPQERAPNETRRSYAQLGYDIARELEKPLCTFICAPDCPYDTHEPEPEELRALQQAHCAALDSGDDLSVPIEDASELKRHLFRWLFHPDGPIYDLPKTRYLAASVAASRPPMLKSQPAAPAVAPVQYENVQFTAYRPRAVCPGKWEKLLVFAHLDERPEWMNAEDRAPVEEVEAQAAALLGPRLDAYRHTTDESRLAIPRDGEITLIPELPGFEFNPPRRSFFWKDGMAVQGESFAMRADASLEGRTARGRITVFHGVLILAEINLSIRVDSRQGTPPARQAGGEKSGAGTFRRIFASYSHRDEQVVERLEHHARSLGDEFLRDRVNLRSGEAWNARLRAMVNEADVFQLFWSWNAARSEYVEQEWRYALQLGRVAFVRPTYWQEPMPPPPEPLRGIHFFRLGFDATADSPAAAAPAYHPPVLTRPLSAATPLPCAAAPEWEPPGPSPATPMLPAASGAPAARRLGSAWIVVAAPVMVCLVAVLFIHTRPPGTTIGANDHSVGVMSIPAGASPAPILADEGKYVAAEPLDARAGSHVRVLEPDHPERLDLDYRLSVMLQKQGRLTEALPLAEQAVGGAARSMPADNPTRRKYESNLADLRAKLAASYAH